MNYVVYNNQTGGAVARIWSGANGTGSILATICPGYLTQVDLNPAWSITLSPS